MSDEDVKAGVEAMHAAKALGQRLYPLFELKQYTHISLVIDGDHYVTDDTMLKVYNGLKRGESWLAGDIIASCGESHGIRWGTITDTKVHHYDHGKNGENGGHFVVEGYIGLREP